MSIKNLLGSTEWHTLHVLCSAAEYAYTLQLFLASDSAITLDQVHWPFTLEWNWNPLSAQLYRWHTLCHGNPFHGTCANKTCAGLGTRVLPRFLDCSAGSGC